MFTYVSVSIVIVMFPFLYVPGTCKNSIVMFLLLCHAPYFMYVPVPLVVLVVFVRDVRGLYSYHDVRGLHILHVPLVIVIVRYQYVSHFRGFSVLCSHNQR
jgi:hypothetical protein